MGVSFYNFSDLHHQSFKEKILSRFKDIVDNGAFVEGHYNNEFEKEFAALQGVKHCLLVANGTDALEIALVVSGVKPGDKVGVPGITFYATAEAVLNIGAIPVLVDVDYVTGLMCPDSFKRVSEAHELKAVMPVHIYGLPADMKAINEIAAQKNIAIIEDAAQAQGAQVHTGPVGSCGNLTTFSFYPTKNLSAFGDAGCILTDNDELAEAIKVVRNHGRGDAEKFGRNSRCDHMQAAVLHLKLEEVDKFNKSRKEIAATYHSELKGLDLDLVDEKFLQTSAWHLYPIQLKDASTREALQAHLKSKDIGSTPFYDVALSQEIPMKNCEGEKEVSEKKAGATICLPMHPFLTRDDAKTVADEIRNFLN